MRASNPVEIRRTATPTNESALRWSAHQRKGKYQSKGCWMSSQTQQSDAMQAMKSRKKRRLYTEQSITHRKRQAAFRWAPQVRTPARNHRGGSPGEHGQERITETVTAGPQRQGSRRPPAAETVPLRTVPQDRGITAGTGRPRC